MNLPNELWSSIAESYLDSYSSTALGLINKQFAQNQLLKEVILLLRNIKAYSNSPIFGTQTFVVSNEHIRDTAQRLLRGKLEYDEMEKRMPSEVTKLEQVANAQKLFRLYNIWKSRNQEYSDEQSIARNQEAFDYYTANRAYLEELVLKTWGYTLSQTILSFMMFWRATNKYGLVDFIQNIDTEYLMGMLQWILCDQDRKLKFREVGGKPVDIRLHHRYNDPPELLTVLYGCGSDCDRTQLLYDLPDLPTCVVSSDTCSKDEPIARTLLEHYAKLALHEIQSDEWVAESSEDEVRNDEDILQEYDYLWTKMYIIEQIMRFERVLGYAGFSASVFTERRTRDFNTTMRVGVIGREGLGVYAANVTAEMIQEANSVYIDPWHLRMSNHSVIDLFRSCKERGNYFTVLRFARKLSHYLQSREHSIPEILQSYINVSPAEDLNEIMNYISDAYAQLGAPNFAEICQLLVWSHQNPGAVSGSFAVYETS